MKRATPKGHNIASNDFELKCKRCGKTWNYEGEKKPGIDYPIYTSCPTCKTSVQVI